MATAIQFVQDGKVLDYKNSSGSDISYLQIVEGTDKVFVAAATIANGDLGAVFAEGVFELPAKAADEFTFGQKVYYSATDGITSTATDNTYAGYVVEAKAAAATTAKVNLNK